MSDLAHVTVHEIGPANLDGRFDITLEQQLLRDHERIVWQFPWYWYSVPAVLKARIDQVLTHGFAYGSSGTALRGKTLHLVTSTAGRKPRALLSIPPPVSR
ncbi:NAD(P)H-dependent oxidoreductase [Streptomyces sp. NPDC056161]|uniref:NAD(P)H-dependent oxidoreductase n=1 Tax=Streptomyces sp. NPDC056161 TaxID=3345732 RepID=UPI0035D96556